MDIQIRPGTLEDLPAIIAVDGISFGFSYSEEHKADVAERGINFTVATEGERVVGISGDFRFDLSVPGGGRLNVPGVTWVSVLPTHRRRGVLTAMMTALLDGYAGHGDACALLTASEGSIYRRFGYGVATQMNKLVIDRCFARLRTPVDSSAVEFLSISQAKTQLPELHRRWEQQVPGALSRDETWWNAIFKDREYMRDGMSERQYLAHPGGYLSYRAREQWQDGRPQSTCVITDYKIQTPEAHAALWQVLLGLDLFATIETWEVPADDPLPLLLTDPRQVRIAASKDGMWLRPLDIATLLATRRYQVEVEAVLEVDGDRFALTGGPDGAECARTDLPAQVWLDRPSLGSIYLGGYRVNTVARARLLRCDDSSRLRQLDLAFGAERSPEFGTAF